MSRAFAVKMLIVGAALVAAGFGWLEVEKRHPIFLQLIMPENNPLTFTQEEMRIAVEHQRRTGKKTYPLRRYNADGDKFEEWNAAAGRYERAD